MVVHHINRDDQFSSLFEAAKQKLFVIDFYADWCGPCRMVAPRFEELSNTYKDVLFAKVNVDTCKMTCGIYQIRAMPTFVVLSNGAEVGRIQGADIQGVERLIQQHFQPVIRKANPKQATPAERKWLDENIVSRVAFVNQYEDEVNQTIALSIIPLDDIKSKSVENGQVQTFLLAKNLMDWFHGFFKWVDSPVCKDCTNEKTVFIGNTEATSAERERGGSRVEIFECDACKGNTRFVRYNNPVTLIETREGRCGEWANCFTLCCRAVGLEARYVFCTEDHVWTEIFDQTSGSWVHCDPCENVIDRPLLYERGWKKQISYVFGIAYDHVMDVTWRYVFDHKECLKRRKSCSEPALLNCLIKLNQRLERVMTEERKVEMKNRLLRELIQFLSPKLQLRAGDDEQGRVSGGIEWKTQRKEIQLQHSPQTILLSETEKKIKCFILEYNCVTDRYKRVNNDNEEKEGLLSYACVMDNIQRKVERDWKMAYICREPGSKSADISWKISTAGLKMSRIKISIGAFSLFHGGKGVATVCAGDLCHMIDVDGVFDSTECSDAEYVELSLNLRGGEGNEAWQHSQIFRTSLADPKQNLIIQIDF